MAGPDGLLLDTMTKTTRVFVRENLSGLGRERDRIEAAPQMEPVDQRAVAVELRAYVGRLDEIRSCGTVEEQKTFLRGVIDRIEVRPREGEALVFWKKLPAPPATGSNGAGMSITVVAGARYSVEKTSADHPECLPLPGRRAA